MSWTPLQMAELRDAMARSQLEARQESRRLARLAKVPRAPRQRKPRKPKQSVTAPVTDEPLRAPDLDEDERVVFFRLVTACCCDESTVDVIAHCAQIARVVVAMRRHNGRVAWARTIEEAS